MFEIIEIIDEDFDDYFPKDWEYIVEREIVEADPNDDYSWLPLKRTESPEPEAIPIRANSFPNGWSHLCFKRR